MQRPRGKHTLTIVHGKVFGWSRWDTVGTGGVRGCGMRAAMLSRAGHAGLTRPYQGSLPYSSCSGKPLVIFKLGAARWGTKI